MINYSNFIDKPFMYNLENLFLDFNTRLYRSY